MQRTLFFFGLTVKTKMDQVQGLVFCLGAVQVLLLIVAAILAQIRPATQNDVFLKNEDKYDYKDGRLIVLEDERVVTLKEQQQTPHDIIGFLQTVNGIIGVLTFAVFRRCFPTNLSNIPQQEYFVFLIGSLTIGGLGLTTLITGALNRLDLWNLYVLNPNQTVGITPSTVAMSVSISNDLLYFNVTKKPIGVPMADTNPQSLPLGYRYEFDLQQADLQASFNVGTHANMLKQSGGSEKPALNPSTQQPYVTKSSDDTKLFVDLDKLGLVSGSVLYAYYEPSGSVTTHRFVILNPDAIEEGSAR